MLKIETVNEGRRDGVSFRAERSPTDLVESKRGVGGESTEKGKTGSLSFTQHCNLGQWIASVASRSSMQSIPTT